MKDFYELPCSGTSYYETAIVTARRPDVLQRPGVIGLRVSARKHSQLNLTHLKANTEEQGGFVDMTTCKSE